MSTKNTTATSHVIIITQLTIKTVYTLLRTYNVTSSTTFLTFLFCTDMLTIYRIYTT